MAITLVMYTVNEQIHTFKQNGMSLLLISIGLHAKTWTATFHSMPFITANQIGIWIELRESCFKHIISILFVLLEIAICAHHLMRMNMNEINKSRTTITHTTYKKKTISVLLQFYFISWLSASFSSPLVSSIHWYIHLNWIRTISWCSAMFAVSVVYSKWTWDNGALKKHVRYV